MKRALILVFCFCSLSAVAQDLRAEQTKTADRKFWTVTGLAAASTVSDVEVTAHALQNPNCTEHNPLFGSHPSRARMYGVSIPATAGYALLGYWLKKRHVNLWAVPQLSLTAGHGIGSALSARCF